MQYSHPITRHTPDLGVLVVDPRNPHTRTLIPLCEQGSVTKCLIATMASFEIGKRVTVHLNHQDRTGTIGLTDGDYRYTRNLTREEYTFAEKFDQGKGSSLRKALIISLNLRDGRWTIQPKSVGGGNKDASNRNGSGNPKIKSDRAKSLALWRARQG